MRNSKINRRLKLVTTILGLVVLLGGCVWGQKLKNYEPATSGQGILASIELAFPAPDMVVTRMSGELLEVKSAGLTVLHLDRVVFVPFTDIRSATFEQDSRSSFGRSGITGEKAERLRLQSRFPQGIDDDILARLLEIHGQTEVITYTPE